MKAYRIKNWSQIYEKSQARRCEKMCWIAVPNSWDGVGYAMVMAHDRYAEIFTAWILLLQIASKMPERGLLANGKPETPQTMALRTRAKADIFELALEVLAKPEIGWIETIDYPLRANSEPTPSAVGHT